MINALTKQITGELKFDPNGLIPAVVQDAATKDVLMVAWMNAEAVAKTLESGETWFYSRSRGELWHKGGTSGNTQKVVEIRYDCDGDTLLVLVHPAGPACHTGAVSCFYRKWYSSSEEFTSHLPEKV
ncbi:MAG: phosphoribosyl-AMP cyclohydrolase [Anaerolineales bacterium]|nr:phosphoribosyl-AMP cyclohydrolase [Anaerolineales bacterium]MCX7756536.1 phosphoribosyl-AMP cyclohydrolase [Anaerolineales bacterium]MDW8279387.1 phosphoribosyl-AMP cyclohydrolase [Anaerolineales bacterium]